MSITFVVPVNDDIIFNDNFLASPLLINKDYEIIFQRGFDSASKAYNDAIDRSKNDIIVFAHQDVLFPDFWENELLRSLNYLKEFDPNWGVIGCYGENRDHKSRKGYGYLYCTANNKLLGDLLEHPMLVQTLDEVVLISRKSSGLRFDECLPHYHLYGTDICLISKSKGMNCYAISAFCVHNSRKTHILPKEFWDCYKYIKKKWRFSLPIETTCIKISKHDIISYFKYRYWRKFKYLIIGLYNKKLINDKKELSNPMMLLHKIKNEYKIRL